MYIDWEVDINIINNELSIINISYVDLIDYVIQNWYVTIFK